MKHISVKVTDSEYAKVEMLRGDKTISEYVRMVLFEKGEKANIENNDFLKLFQDVALISDTIKGVATKRDLLAHASFLVEVATAGNPLSYSHEQNNIQQLHQMLASKMQSEG
jgi:hypothetical protein